MSVPEMREWLRNWVANATGQSPDGIDESVTDGGARPVVA
jgi:polyketide synthase 13